MDIVTLSKQVARAKPLAYLPDPEECARIRRDSGVSRTDAAAAAGISAKTLQRIEAGTTHLHVGAQRQYRCLLAVLRAMAMDVAA